MHSADKRGYITPNLTKASLIAEFCEVLFYGGDIRRTLTTAYNPHRYFTPGARKVFSEIFDKALESDSLLDGVMWASRGVPSLDKFLTFAAPVHDHRPPADFPAALARDLIDEFTPPGGAVLDPCHGWGGRLLGFMLSRKAARYVGFDVDERTSAGVSEMYHDLLPFAMASKEAVLELCPFEDSQLDDNSFDFAFTSPPYFDVEKYGGELSSWRRYKGGFNAWVDGFYRPLIEKTTKALKPGGTFALQVGNQTYPLEETAMQIATNCDLRWLRTSATGMINNKEKTPEGDGEVVVVFTKPGAATVSAALSGEVAAKPEEFDLEKDPFV